MGTIEMFGIYLRMTIFSNSPATAWISCFIGDFRIGTGDSPPCRWYTIGLLSLLLCISELVAVRGFLLQLAGVSPMLL
ncbi:hypothetical protein HAX54_019668, partial [Datura stramonium]|nr:hypothetical protein [Datura stramonium]